MRGLDLEVRARGDWIWKSELSILRLWCCWKQGPAIDSSLIEGWVNSPCLPTWVSR